MVHRRISGPEMIKLLARYDDFSFSFFLEQRNVDSDTGQVRVRCGHVRVGHNHVSVRTSLTIEWNKVHVVNHVVCSMFKLPLLITQPREML